MKLRQSQRIVREFSELQQKLNELDLERQRAEVRPQEIEGALALVIASEPRLSAAQRSRAGELARMEERHAEELRALKTKQAEEHAAGIGALENATKERRAAEDEARRLRDELAHSRIAVDAFIPRRVALARELARLGELLPQAQEKVALIEAKEAEKKTALAQGVAAQTPPPANGSPPVVTNGPAAVKINRPPSLRFFEAGQRLKRPKTRAQERENRRR